MKTIRLEVRDDIFSKVFDFLKLLPEDSFKVEVEEPDDIFTKKDEKEKKGSGWKTKGKKGGRASL